jgi:hypothetical protein
MVAAPSIQSVLRLAPAALLAVLALLAAGPGKGTDATGPVVLRVYSDYI